jgi:hypothetical protein
MKGLIEEGSEWIGEEAAAEVMDAGIIEVYSARLPIAAMGFPHIPAQSVV